MFKLLIKAPMLALLGVLFLFGCFSPDQLPTEGGAPSSGNPPPSGGTTPPPSGGPPSAQLPVDQVSGPLSVIVLGSGGPVATAAGRASAGYLIFTNGTPRILLDVGGGTFQRLAASGANIKDLDTVLLSHLHLDHTGDLSAVIKTIFFHNLAAGTVRSAPINVYGPAANGVAFPNTFPAAEGADLYPSTSGYIKGHYDIRTGTERYLHFVANAISGSVFSVTAYNIPPAFLPNNGTPLTPEILPTPIPPTDGLVMRAIGVNHGPDIALVPALAFRIEFAGLSIVYSGDTTSTTDNMIELARGADLLIYDTAIMDGALPPFSLLHTTPTRIGLVAAAAGVTKLILSHITPATEANIAEIETLIRAQGFTGMIQRAADLDVYNLGTLP